jgi:uncharacterized RDD family membrane protein YckC
MRIKWTKILFRLLGFELLARELIKLFAKGLHSFKEDIRKRLVAWAIKAAILLLLLGIAQVALLFGLSALALYLNTLLGSSYQGFLLVSGGCMASLLLLWLLSRVR